MAHHKTYIVVILLLSQGAFAQSSDEGIKDHFGKQMKPKEKQELSGAFGQKNKKPKERKQLSSAFGNKISKPKDREEMGSAFTKQTKRKKDKDTFLPDYYANAVKKLDEHNQLPSFFSKAIKKERERTAQPDFFGRKGGKVKRELLTDHFGKKDTDIKRKEPKDHFGSATPKEGQRKEPKDHFASKGKGNEASEDDVEVSFDKKRFLKKNFIGERFKLFSRDPNQKKKKAVKKEKRKHRDHFGRDARKQNRAQNPRGEMDLFDGGVMPKMKDMR
ncbi:MAG: hypothetical protein HQ500_00005 [Flavobacteriales bacterium]|nr:hypothetical protein [Flavobacteriales bacterium]